MHDLAFTCTPIGYFSAEVQSSYELPRQSGRQKNSGKIVLNPAQNFEQALSDLEGFDFIWLIYWFHEKHGWKPKIQPPRGGKKRGLFATRSPHRPNPIGISTVMLTKICGRELSIENHDLLDQTPILDIKPYIPYADAHPNAKNGWLDEVAHFDYEIVIDELAQLKNNWINERTNLDLIKAVVPILRHNPTPSSSNRIKQQADDRSILAFKTWRVVFSLNKQAMVLRIVDIQSGYTLQTISDTKESFEYTVQIEFLNNFLDRNYS